ncbi:endonuclease/exonuclease/phosphatase family protein [Pseudarthrobacter sp. NamE2]|uniref:endonuclease/exonuclease/phosphatase family protein n=1 Tax=Pseudarthrobacter sp. NamE2 TaxID=2576838 RepID=UPI001485C051|nr:endonuclease/exonuclease/phosphatase family protein [Pseudarthrobacter sp. NamE2]
MNAEGPKPVFRRLAGLAAAPVAGVAVVRAVPADWPVLAVQLLAFVPWFTVPAAVAFGLALASRSRPLQLVTAVLLAVQVLWLFPPPTAGYAAAHAGPPSVQVKAMAINAELGEADAEGIVDLVREQGVELLTVEEYTQELADRLADAGLPAILPYQVAHPRGRAAGAAVYSSFPLVDAGVVPGTRFTMPVVRVALGPAGNGADLQVVAVHTLAPVGDGLGQWRSDFAALGRADPGSGPLLLAGDFNATLDHREFRTLLAGGYGGRPLVDVAAAAGSRLVPTWPMRGYHLPGVTLDHLVTSQDIRGSSYSVHRLPGTDHAAVAAALEIHVG